MKKSIASITLILSLCLIIGSFAGCAGSGTAPASSAAPAPAPAPSSSAAPAPAPAPAEPAAGPVELSISWWGGDSRHEATQKALDAFTAKYPNITVKTNYGAWTGWPEAMSTAFFAGTAQDVNQVNWNWLFNYDNSGKTFVDLKGYSDYIDMSQFNENALAQCTVDGRLSAIPVAMTGRIFFWNTATYEKAGIAPPKSLDELLAAGETFKTKLGNDFYPLAMNEYDRMIFMVWALECKYGKDWVVDNKLNYSKEEIMEGLEIISRLEAAHVIPSIQTIAGDGADSLDKNPKWIEGKYAGILEWDSAATKFKDALSSDNEAFKVGDYLTGFGDKKGGFTKVSLGFAIAQSSKNPNEAATLINFLLNEDEGVKIMKSERGIPLSKAALAVCTAEGLLNPLVTEANGKVLAWCSNKLDPNFENAKLNAINEGVYWDVMAGYSYGDYDASKAADVLIEGINGVLSAA